MWIGGIYDDFYPSTINFQTGKSNFIYSRLSEMGRLEKLEEILFNHSLCDYVEYNFFSIYLRLPTMDVLSSIS